MFKKKAHKSAFSRRKAAVFAAALFFLLICIPAVNNNICEAFAGNIRHHNIICVKVEGLVSRPGTYKLAQGSRLSVLLGEIWPPLPQAYLKDTVLYRKRLKIDGKIELIGIRREISRLKGLSRRVKDKISRQFSGLHSDGGIVIRVRNPVLLLNKKDDIRLKNGDAVIFMPRPKYVFVEGAVRNPGKFGFVGNRTCGRYLKEAGGLRSAAVRGFLYILRAGGGIEKINSRFIAWNNIKKRWELAFFKKPEIINAGDIIFVPFNYGNATLKLTELILAVYKRTGVLLDYSP